MIDESQEKLNGSLEIHLINVGQGESVLLINRDLAALKAAIENAQKLLPEGSMEWLRFAIQENINLDSTVKSAVLIDAGDRYYEEDVLAYLKAYGVQGASRNKRFYTVVSHYHGDHIGGLKKVFEECKPSIAYDMGSDPILDPPTKVYRDYREFLRNAFLGIVHTTISLNEKIDGNNCIDMGEDNKNVPIKIFCLAANGVVKTEKDATEKDANKYIIPISGQKKPITRIDQNDRTVVLLLKYGQFSCLIGGDAGGDGGVGGDNGAGMIDERKRLPWSSHGNLEEHLPAAIACRLPNSHVCCFKSHHHGSASSNDYRLLNAMKPCIVLCSSGTKTRFHGHPTQEVINRIKELNPKPTCYITEMAENGTYSWGGKRGQQYTRNLHGISRIMGDIIVRPILVGDGVEIQVYGTGIHTRFGNADKQIRVAEQNQLGPFTHKCTHT